MAGSRTPAGLSAGGCALWRSVTEAHDLDAVQEVTLLEACRAKDRLDKLDEVLRGDEETWMRLIKDDRTEYHELKIDAALASANTTANLLKQLLAALRLPDEEGKKPQQRGGARGAYSATPKTPAAGAGKVSSLDRARAAKTGA
jgi:hypothetical protein